MTELQHGDRVRVDRRGDGSGPDERGRIVRLVGMAVEVELDSANGAHMNWQGWFPLSRVKKLSLLELIAEAANGP